MTRSALEAGAGALDARPVAAGGVPHPGSEVDPDDTTRCPLAPSCASCGSAGPALIVVTTDTPVGIACATVCSTCLDRGVLPPVAVAAAVRLVIAHAAHLGCTVDDLDPSRSSRS